MIKSLGAGAWGVLFAIVFFSSSCLWSIIPSVSWHDQQRIFFICLCLFLSVLSFFLRLVMFGRQTLLGVFVVLCIGLFSSLYNDGFYWSLNEWATYGASVISVIVLSNLFRKEPSQVLLFGVAALVGFVLSVQFAVSYIYSLVLRLHVMSPGELVSGFSNIRFYGQFQVMLVPILSALIVRFYGDCRKFSVLLFLLLVVQWGIVWGLSGRGVILSLFLTSLLLCILSRQNTAQFKLQISAAGAGFLLYMFLFVWLPDFIGMEVELGSSLRSGLSARELIWSGALDMAIAHPWVGVGPMQFSAVWNPVASHPHQVVLQWLAEWGVVATLIAITVACWGVYQGRLALLSVKSCSIDGGLWAAIVGALLLAQVDGVFVMPYAQGWLIILIGLAVARWTAIVEVPRFYSMGLRFLALSVILIFGHTLIFEVPNLDVTQEAARGSFGAGLSRPRFWVQGWIPVSERDPEGATSESWDY
nr:MULTISPECIES: O-antigen ligase family protein [Pseudomonas]